MKKQIVKASKVKATIKQKQAIINVVENGGNISKAMIDAGYKPATAKTPQKLTESRAWQQLMQKYLPDEKLLKAHEEGLEANRVISAVNTNKQANGATTDFIEVPDHQTRAKFLELGYKIKGKFKDDDFTEEATFVWRKK